MIMILRDMRILRPTYLERVCNSEARDRLQMLVIDEQTMQETWRDVRIVEDEARSGRKAEDVRPRTLD